MMLASLLIVPAYQLHLHEAHEHSRLDKIKSAILAEGNLRHPILVTQMSEDRYLIIDGAHRYQALCSIGCTKIPVQVINSDHITLSMWEHEVQTGEWLEAVRFHPSWIWYEKLTMQQWIATLIDEDGKMHWLAPIMEPSDLIERLNSWHQLVNLYIDQNPVRRLPLNSNHLPEKGHVQFRFPAWSIADIEYIVARGKVLPAGTTQFITEEGMLNLKIPLHLLTTSMDCTNEWNNLKRDWSTSLRYYPGGVYLNDM